MMARWFWRLYWPAVALALAGHLLGPAVEARFWPIRRDVVHDIARTHGRLCWIADVEKMRMAQTDNVDVFLDTPDGDRSYPEIVNPETGQAWHRLGAVPVGHHVVPLCIELPGRVGAITPVVLRQTVSYRGWLGLWTVQVPLPDIESPAPPD